jgi:hypothetical protein
MPGHWTLRQEDDGALHLIAPISILVGERRCYGTAAYWSTAVT